MSLFRCLIYSVHPKPCSNICDPSKMHAKYLQSIKNNWKIFVIHLKCRENMCDLSKTLENICNPSINIREYLWSIQKACKHEWRLFETSVSDWCVWNWCVNKLKWICRIEPLWCTYQLCLIRRFGFRKYWDIKLFTQIIQGI